MTSSEARALKPGDYICRPDVVMNIRDVFVVHPAPYGKDDECLVWVKRYTEPWSITLPLLIPLMACWLKITNPYPYREEKVEIPTPLTIPEALKAHTQWLADRLAERA